MPDDRLTIVRVINPHLAADMACGGWAYLADIAAHMTYSLEMLAIRSGVTFDTASITWSIIRDVFEAVGLYAEVDPTVFTCHDCGATTTDPDRWDRDHQGLTRCDPCWYDNAVLQRIHGGQRP